MKNYFSLFAIPLTFSAALMLSQNVHAEVIVPLTSASILKGSVDNKSPGTFAKNDNVVSNMYSNSKAILSAKFVFKKAPQSNVKLVGSLKQLTAKDTFLFEVLNSNGTYDQIGSITGATSLKSFNFNISSSYVLNGVITVRLNGKNVDDISIDYLAISDSNTGTVTPPPVVVSPPPVVVSPPPVVVTPPPSNNKLPAGTSWYWQLQGTINTASPFPAQVYDIDLFDNTEATFNNLKSKGKTIICYFSAGTFEPNRPDSSLFPSAAVGNGVSGWPQEKWLDTRDAKVRQIMVNRLILAKTKGCDGVEPDNVDGYTNKPGFPLTIDTQKDFNAFLANQAHAQGLLVALKNATDLVSYKKNSSDIPLVNLFDFAVVEECFKYNECSAYSPFILQNKAVLSAEYTTFKQATCDTARTLNFSTSFFNLDLNGKNVQACQ